MSATTKFLALVMTTAGIAAACSPANAATSVLTFSGNICGPAGDAACGDGTEIGQNYGDTAQVDVSYRAFNAATGVTTEPYLKHWTSRYGDLANVVWGGTNPTSFTAEIVFTPIAGYEVSLIGFDAGCYLYRTSCRTFPFTVQSVSGASILSDSASPPEAGHASVAINSAYFADGIILRWGPDSYDAGLDNIAFDVRAIDPGASPVPEPASWAMLLLGFGLMGAAMRRVPVRAVSRAS